MLARHGFGAQLLACVTDTPLYPSNQAERVHGELGELRQWHRDTALPQHAELLQKGAAAIDVLHRVPSQTSAGLGQALGCVA